ncbi:MAG: PAS domain-containing sensor histidine kinase [Candidatus Saccharimonadales bacterium]
MAINPLPPVPKKTSHGLSNHADILSDVLFLSIGEGAILVDERGYIARVNKPALDILGYEAKDLVGKWYPETIVAEDANGSVIPNLERPITEVFFRGQPVFRKMYYRRKNKSSVGVTVSVAPILFDDKPLGAIQLFRDITEELLLENAKDEFISIASHQLRTPATVVKQYLGMILEGFVTNEEKMLEMIRIANDQNNNQLEIINDLLKVAQIESNAIAPSYKETDIVEILQKIVISQQPHYDKRNIKLRLQPVNDPVVINVDPLHIQMVFENLIDNANKYSPPGTTVSLRITSTPSFITMSIKDQGVGIEASDIPKLFNKFSRINNPESLVSGTGLGLYWARKLVELYGGKIGVRSELQKGTTFSVRLPRKKPIYQE